VDGCEERSSFRIEAMLQLSRADARRIAVQAQLLDAQPATELLDVVRKLTLLQVQSTATIAPSAELVAWSRLGSTFVPAELEDARAGGALVELRGMIRPSEDVALYRADMARWDTAERGDLPGWRASQRDWVRANDACRRDLLARLDAAGPLPARELPDTCAVPWRSSGWNNDRNVTLLLEFMEQRGEVAVAGRTNGSGCGTWRSASTRTTRSSRRPRPRRAGTSCGCARWVSLAGGAPSARSSHRTSVRPAIRR
jgi:uncharacterized protein